MRPVFVHIRNTANLGDLNSCPAEGFSDYDDCRRIDLSEVKHLPEGTPLIVGGGGLFMEPTHHIFKEWSKKHPVIVWGAGLNYPNDGIAQNALDGILGEGLRACKLVGIRNETLASAMGFDFVPCGSCMNPVFDSRHIPEYMNGTAVYEHADRRFAFRGLKAKTNKSDSFHEVIQLLGSVRRVITNSFHGAYWSLLLGRRVIVWEPNHFGDRIVEGLPTGLLRFAANAPKEALESNGYADCGYLRECRVLNREFKLKVDKFLASVA